MRRTVLGVGVISAVLLVSTGISFAGPNCAMVKKDLSMGRTPDDIAERMMTTVDEVKKCQGADAAPGNSGNTPAADNAGKNDDKGADDSHSDH